MRLDELVKKYKKVPSAWAKQIYCHAAADLVKELDKWKGKAEALTPTLLCKL